jgi:DNA-directed RNA polymerase specialized sigma subunit
LVIPHFLHSHATMASHFFLMSCPFTQTKHTTQVVKVKSVNNINFLDKSLRIANNICMIEICPNCGHRWHRKSNEAAGILSKLTEKQRERITRYMSGMKAADIAKSEGVSTIAVYRSISRAKATIRRLSKRYNLVNVYREGSS